MRYIIGIDLGTTNSAIAYIDTESPTYPIHLFSIPQLIETGRVESLFTLPSFCYLLSKEEWPLGSLRLPWKEETETFVGLFAKKQGARVPTRLVQSAKSWLCNVAANRRDKILPLETDDVLQRLSPIEASAKYLSHLREAWNVSIAKGNSEAEFEEQEIILTVPASFDEVARTLTVEAARLAGLRQITLLEEPQAAFYSWISQHEANWQKKLKAEDVILVCDVGGGTTDFSLIEVKQTSEGLAFQRMAVGEHLLLGGDNIDAAIANYLEQKLQSQGTSLNPSQWHQLLAEARSAKEFLFDETNSLNQSYTIVLQGLGSSVVKGSLSINLYRAEVEKLVLEGFFGQYDLADALTLAKSRGFRTMGLPYADEPSITKHMAHFLQQANHLDRRIDYILFNGGTMKPAIFQQAIYQSLNRWFPQSNPHILTSPSLDLAVAKGAAYYGKARRGFGIKIKSGLPRAYYLEVDVKEDSHSKKQALTLLPRGAEDGLTFEPSQTFFVRPNTPVAFYLLTSHTRLHDKQGELVVIDEQELQKLPAIQTILRFGRRSIQADKQDSIPVHLGIRLTEMGILELWLQSQITEHKWNLEFQLRTAAGQDQRLDSIGSKLEETFDSQYLQEAKKTIEDSFESPNSSIKPSSIMEKLEEQMVMNRREWSSSVLRELWNPLLRVASQRKKSEAHEVRWWNLAGFFLRPGFGFSLDDFRIKELWKIILSDLKSNQSLDSQIQHWICYRRVAGGLNKGQQMQIASELMATLYNKKSGKIEIKGKSELYAYSEKIRALASLERIELLLKIRLGEAILTRIKNGEAASCDYWALGRIGARHLIYGSAGQVVPRDICSKWIEQLLHLPQIDLEQMIFLIGQLARKTDHRELNLPQPLLNKVIEYIPDSRLPDLLFQSRILTLGEQEQIFGDGLPSGLLLKT